MTSNYRKIGNFIRQVNVRNDKGNIELLLGVNLDKVFIPSVANTNGVDMTKYKVIKKGQFGCKLMSVGRDKKLPISRLVKHEKALISSAYFVFEVIDESILNPEYLMMWFRREESDRFLWFLSGGDVRGRITWDDLCELPIKVPPIEKQNEIINEYNTIVNRIKLNEQLNQKLEDTAQALYRQWFVDFEFPNEEGKPYKSSGGDMAYNEELDKEIPVGWEADNLSNFLEVKYGKDYKHLNHGEIPLYGSGGIMKYVDKFLYDKPSVLIPRKGSLSNILYLDEPFWSVDTMFFSKIIKPENGFYTFYYLKTLDFYALNVGSAVPSMTTSLLNSLRLLSPSKSILIDFDTKLNSLFKYRKKKNVSSKKLKELENVILSKMTKVDVKVEKEIV